MAKIISAKEINRRISGRVMGQDTKQIALAVANHLVSAKKPWLGMKKENMLVKGPTGCGKTETFRAIREFAEEMGIPVVIVNVLDYSPTETWKGKSINALFRDALWMKAADTFSDRLHGSQSECIGQLKDICERAIVVLDEFDKICTSGEESRDMCHDYQSNLLKMIEGNEYEIGNIRNDDPEDKKLKTSIRTDNMMFVLMGAFTGLMENRNREMGFCAVQNDCAERAITQEDLIRYGVMRELVGRLTVFAEYRTLTEDTLVRIMQECESSAYKDFQKRFRNYGHALFCDEDALHDLAKTVMERKTGARGLEALFHETFDSVLYELTDSETPMRCVLKGKGSRPSVTRVTKKTERGSNAS